MQNLNIKIYGDYWESFVYMGKLYLLTLSNKLIVYDWKQIIKDCKASNNKESHNFIVRSLSLGCSVGRGSTTKCTEA